MKKLSNIRNHRSLVLHFPPDPFGDPATKEATQEDGTDASHEQEQKVVTIRTGGDLVVQVLHTSNRKLSDGSVVQFQSFGQDHLTPMLQFLRESMSLFSFSTKPLHLSYSLIAYLPSHYEGKIFDDLVQAPRHDKIWPDPRHRLRTARDPPGCWDWQPQWLWTLQWCTLEDHCGDPMSCFWTSLWGTLLKMIKRSCHFEPSTCLLNKITFDSTLIPSSINVFAMRARFAKADTVGTGSNQSWVGIDIHWSLLDQVFNLIWSY